ncbi:MAG: acetate kinase [Methylococcales bacterium]|nr:acetate kinase [Methylococcales bacterium]
MKILVINSGSSSLKYTLFKFPEQISLLNGLFENIGTDATIHHLQWGTQKKIKQPLPLADHKQALLCLLQTIKQQHSFKTINLVAHRVVHGGEKFKQPSLMNATNLAELEQLSPLAPLHNPANSLGIKILLQQLPAIKHIAVFDTAFHATLPDYAYRYPVPNDWYQQHKIRRYGFHGSSHAYVAKQAALMLNKPLNHLNIISLHLGNGASACAIQNGISIDTSMGFTPNEGLMMGTRSGDIDTAIYPYLQAQTDLSITEIDGLLNNASGLKAIASTNDLREVHKLIAAKDSKAKLAFAMLCYRIKKYIGAYYAVLGHLDALIFTGGMGENDAELRAKCCENLAGLGLKIDIDKNQAHDDCIQAPEMNISILVIQTNEELEIAQQAHAIIN